MGRKKKNETQNRRNILTCWVEIDANPLCETLHCTPIDKGNNKQKGWRDELASEFLFKELLEIHIYNNNF